MTPKYYTPEIEEFCIGFSFEILNTEGLYFIPNKPHNCWNKTKINTGIFSDLQNIEVLLIEKQIRVKHLDREDIEECGWIQRDYDTFGFNNQYSFEFNPEYKSFIYLTERKSESTLFRGDIKNKEDLKKLMLQLGIN